MVQVETVLYPLVESDLWLIGDVDVLVSFDIEEMCLVVNLSVHDTIP